MVDVANEKDTDVMQVVLSQALRVPGVKINRDKFLKNALSIRFKKEVVEVALKFSPAKAGITPRELDRIAKAIITRETRSVSTISAAAGLPGKFAVIATIPADLTQYFAHIIRVIQKLIYLYGWKDIFNEDGDIDDETFNLITIFIGVMFGVQSANTLISKLAAQAAVRANKTIAAKPLTKGVVYPIVKRIAIAITGKMNKSMFASGVSKMIPVIGAVTSGGLTYVTFKPMANRLKKHLETLPTADVNFTNDNNNYFYEDIIIDVTDFEDIDNT